jgi:flagellar protein FlgJ
MISGMKEQPFVLPRLETTAKSTHLARFDQITGKEVVGPDDAAKKSEQAEVKKVAREFESLFINNLLKEMRKTVHQSGAMKQGNAGKIYQEMLDKEYSQMAAEHGGMGLAVMVERELSKNLEYAHKAAQKLGKL